MPKCDICNKNKNNSFIYYHCNHINCFSCIESFHISKNCKHCKNSNNSNSNNSNSNNLDFINSSQYLSLTNKEMRNYNIFL